VFVVVNNIRLIEIAVILKRSVKFVSIFNSYNLEVLETALDGGAHLLWAGLLLSYVLGQPQSTRSFPMCSLTVSTVSQGGTEDGEGDSAVHDPAAPASKGGRRRRGCGLPPNSWCPGSTSLRRGGWRRRRAACHQ
jgi:hypothetical protein